MNNLCLAIGSLIILVGKTATVNSYNSINEILLEEIYRPNGNMVKLDLVRAQGKGAKEEVSASATFIDGFWQYTPMLNSFSKVTLDYLPTIKSYTVCNDYGCKTLPELFPTIQLNQTVDLVVCTNQ